MKKYYTSLVLAMVLILFAATPVIADALYSGTVRITNSGASTASNVSTNFTLNSDAFIANGYALSDFSDVSVEYNGAPVEFMVGIGSNPWIIFAASVGAGQNIDYTLLANGETGGLTRYFPADAGMTVPDDPSLELSDNGSVSFTDIWLDTTAGPDKYLMDKTNGGTTNGTRAYVSPTVSENVTADIVIPTSGIFRPNEAGDTTSFTPNGAATDWECVSDSGNDTTFIFKNATTSYLQDLYNFPSHTTENGIITSITFSFRIASASGTVYSIPAFKIGGVSYNGTEQSVIGSTFVTKTQIYTVSPATSTAWTWSEIDGLQAGVWLKDSDNQPRCSEVSLTIAYNPAVAPVSATGVAIGEHDVEVGMDLPFLGIAVDTSLELPVTTNLEVNMPFPQTEFNSATFTTIDSNAYSANVTGATWSTEGFSFDGTGDYVSLPDSTMAVTEGTIMMWVRFDRDTVNEDLYSQNTEEWAVRHNGAEIRLFYDGGQYLNWVRTIPLNTWGHIALAFKKGANSWAYENGTLKIAEGLDNVTPTGGQVKIGAQSNGNMGFQGDIVEVQFYDRQLSGTEILQNYNATKWRYDGSTNRAIHSTVDAVPDSSEVWTFVSGGSAMYVGSIEVEVAGAPVSAWEWEYDTTFHDSVGANDATPSFRTTSSDADVSATLIDFQPVSEAEVSYFTLSSELPTLTPPGAVTEMYTEGDYTHIPGAEAVNEMLAEGGVPYSLWWYPFIYLGICIIGFIIYGATQGPMSQSSTSNPLDGSLLTMAVVMEVLIVVAGIMNSVPLWPAYLFPIPAIAIIISRKHYSWG